MAQSYYIRIRGRVSGPFDEDKLALLVQRGQLSRTHEVSEDGQCWTAASELTSLFGRRPESDTPSENARAEPCSKAVTPTGGEPSAQSRGADQWYCAFGGRKLGPLPWTDLRNSIIVGAIPPGALVWAQHMTDWQPASSVPGLTLGTDAATSTKGTTITWGELLPAFQILNDRSWTLAWVQCLAIAVLFPLIALDYHGKEHLGLTWAAVTFSLYFSLLWTAFFHWCIAPERVSAWRVVGTWLFTATLGIMVAITLEVLTGSMFPDVFDETSSASLFKRVVGWTLGVGLIEECGKALAVVAMTHRIKTEATPRTCAFLGAVSGLAFGTIEAIAYTYEYVLQHQQTGDAEGEAYGALVFLLILRWICLPLLHAVWTGIAGFFVGLSYRARTGSWGWVLRGLLIVAVLHGLYDVGAAASQYSWLTIVSAALSLSLFVGYLRSATSMTLKVERCKPTVPSAAG